MKTYTLHDLFKIYLDTQVGSYEDTPTFLLKLSEMEIDELEKAKKEFIEMDYDPNEGDPGSEMDMLADNGGPEQ